MVPRVCCGWKACHMPAARLPSALAYLFFSALCYPAPFLVTRVVLRVTRLFYEKCGGPPQIYNSSNICVSHAVTYEYGGRGRPPQIFNSLVVRSSTQHRCFDANLSGSVAAVVISPVTCDRARDGGGRGVRPLGRVHAAPQIRIERRPGPAALQSPYCLV